MEVCSHNCRNLNSPPKQLVLNILLIFDVNKNDESIWSEPESQKWEVNVMPNPSSGNITVQLQTNSDESWQIEVYNSTGSLVLNTGEMQSGNTVYQNNWSSLSSGLYLVKISQGSETATKRLVIR